MARTVTLSELRTRALRRAKMENSQFPEDGEVDRLVREAVAELYDKLLEVRGAHHYLMAAECVTVPNVIWYPLPADFYKLVSVTVNASPGASYYPLVPGIPFASIAAAYMRSTNGWQAIQPFMDQEAAGLMNATGGSPYSSQYRLRGMQNQQDVNTSALELLEILPVPTGNFLLHIDYIPVAMTESWSSPAVDPVINGINGWEDYVAIRVAMTLLDEEESDTRHLERDLARVEARIQALADNRDSGRPQRIQDTQGLIDGGALLGIDIRPRW
jgi:hypothetical protein